jgi:MFS family permease
MTASEGVALERTLGAVAGPVGDKVRPYAFYALFLLVFANFFNYVDRQIVSIVAHSMQADLHLSDAQLGFLMGTAFAVLYGVFGIAMGRIADLVSRTKLMAAGLVVWSGMTALAGAAGGYGTLAAARIGVGIGEATANPCSHSLLSDYFPARNRSAVIGAYHIGAGFGAAGSLLLGGMLLQHWDEMCHVFPSGACGVASWRAAFFVMGLPGLVLALFLARLREPPIKRAMTSQGILRTALRELSAAVPPFTFINLAQLGGGGAAARNFGLAVILSAIAAGLTSVFGDWLQWAAVGVGLYSVLTWAYVLKIRDRPLYSLTFGCPVFVLTMIGGALTACFSGTVLAWAAPYAIRELGASPGKAGLLLGLSTALSSGVSVVLGGVITDHWKRRDVRAPVWVALIGLLGSTPMLLLLLHASDLTTFVGALFVMSLFGAGWAGGFGALVQDLILPRMRATASAVFSLVIILFSAGVGPYWAGKISTLTGSLSAGLYSLLVLVPAAALVLLAAAARLRRETPETRRARARDAGEDC